MMDKSEGLGGLIDQRIRDILRELAPEIVTKVREGLLADLGIRAASPSAPTVVVPSGPLTPESTQAVLDAATSIGEARGIARTADGKWACAHCQRTFPTQRAATMHAKVCQKNPEHVEPFGGKASWAVRRKRAVKAAAASAAKKPQRKPTPVRRRKPTHAAAHA
jgi:hypothetical protein